MFNRTVKIAHRTAFMNKQETLALTSQCQENNHVTICERKELMDISNDPCEAPLLREQHGKCHLAEKPTATETRLISPGTILVITVDHDVTINSTCGIRDRTLTGIHLVIFHNCSLYVNNELFENFELQFQHPTILPLQAIKIKPLQIDRHINISELQELNFRNRQHMEELQFKHQLGIASLSTVIILIAAILGLSMVKYHRTIKSGNCSGRAKLIGGAVNHRSSNADGVSHESSLDTPCTCTQIDLSAPSLPDDTGHRRNAASLDNATSAPSSLGARLAHLGSKAGQLGL